MIEITADMREDQKGVEILVSAEHKHDFVAREANGELQVAVDLALHKLEAQLRRHKEKIQDHRRTPHVGDAAAPARPAAGDPACPGASGARPMPMTDFVVREAIVPALTATTKEAVVREIVESLRATGYVQAGVADDIVRQILKREQLGSTGI